MRMAPTTIAQIHGHRLPSRNDVDGKILDLALHRIDGRIARNGLSCLFRVCVRYSAQRGRELMLGQAPHSQDFAIQGFEVFVIRGDGMGDHVLSPFNQMEMLVELI